jgi:hypothetical protein
MVRFFKIVALMNADAYMANSEKHQWLELAPCGKSLFPVLILETQP